MMHRSTITELLSVPNKIQAEDSDARIARLAAQKIGSTAGIHPKVLAAQEAHSKVKRRTAIKRAGEKS